MIYEYVTHFTVNVVKFMEMAKDRIPTLRGLKYSSKELPTAHACSLIDNGRLQVLDGSNVGLNDKWRSSTKLDFVVVVVFS